MYSGIVFGKVVGFFTIYGLYKLCDTFSKLEYIKINKKKMLSYGSTGMSACYVT